MRLVIKFAVFSTLAFSACRTGINSNVEVPNMPLLPAATPLAKLALKPDAELEKQIAEIAKEAKGKVGVAAIVLETGDAAFLNADQQFPMQSVYKLPIAMAVMDKVRLGKLDLDEKVGVTKDDMVRKGQRSPLRDANPDGGEFTVRELIRLSLVESDGTASDVQMRILGGANEIQKYLTQIGVNDMKVVNTEKEIGKDWATQYRNYSTPNASVELLRWLSATDKEDRIRNTVTPEPLLPGAICNCQPSTFKDSDRMIKGLLSYMIESKPGINRLRGQLPEDAEVAHKTGTGGTRNGITGATNDIGIIYLPNAQHLAIAVFVSDSPADEKTREAVIAKIAKACWDRWGKI